MLTKFHLSILLAVSLILSGSASLAQSNSDLVELIKSRVPEDVIINIIKSNSAKVDNSSAAVIALKNAGASDKILLAISQIPSGKHSETGLSNSLNGKISIPVGASAFQRIFAIENMQVKELVNDYQNVEVLPIPFSPIVKIKFNGTMSRVRVSSDKPEFRLALPSNQIPSDTIIIFKLSNDENRATRMKLDGGLVSRPKISVPNEIKLPFNCAEVEEPENSKVGLRTWIISLSNPLQRGEYAISPYFGSYLTFGKD